MTEWRGEAELRTWHQPGGPIADLHLRWQSGETDGGWHRAADLPELRAEDLRLAWRSLGRITGRVDVEDLLDVIFRDFCLGK